MSKQEELAQQAEQAAAAASAPDVALSPEEEIAGLSAQVEGLQQELAEARDQMLRAAAEAQNVRRRAEADVEKAHKFALEKFARELLPVVDSLEKASEALGEVDESQKEGVEMTLRLFLGVLEKFQVNQLHPMGQTFDPQFHEAMSMVPNPALPANSVMDVLQKGYTLNERLLRPAMVVVSTGGTTKKIDETA
ncbi:nucleotide exchange factor GrpE [Marinospirillum alkaliphilum]|uniref:Protein GrpE n=1 Tax=Marinospirillum alkaliphilum DSM 21637 TaxID=1122209 RepID=A0A1K1WIR1_9GAMM|nr:nucleotide exchange factor GrpE [Marinospirillum alkaliphilum]SFX37272.1 molecular chaperone GrpE [Marinospirillum alkaliphilum DSM 21637]